MILKSYIFLKKKKLLVALFTFPPMFFKIRPELVYEYVFL